MLACYFVQSGFTVYLILKLLMYRIKILEGDGGGLCHSPNALVFGWGEGTARSIQGGPSMLGLQPSQGFFYSQRLRIRVEGGQTNGQFVRLIGGHTNVVLGQQNILCSYHLLTPEALCNSYSIICTTRLYTPLPDFICIGQQSEK